MKNKKSKIRKIIGASVFTGLAVAFIMAMLLNANISDVITNQPLKQKDMSWNKANLPFLAEAPGADNTTPAGLESGVMNSYVSKLTETYASNLTDVWGSTATNDSSAGTDIPYDVNHELCVKVRWNKTHAYDTAWNLSLVRAYVNCSTCDPAVSAELAEETEIGHNDSFIWVNYHIDNSDTGYSVDRGDSVDSVAWTFEYYG